MSDDLDLNVKIIELVRSNPCLYNQTRSDYSNRNKQDQKWSEIAQILNETVATIKDKWKNIRGRYVKQLKQKPSGSAAKPKKPYYITLHLDFLDTFIRSRTPTGNLQPTENDEAQSSDYIEEQTHSIPNVSEETIDTSATTTPEPRTSTSQSKYYRRKIKKTVTLNDVNKSAVEYFERKKRQNSAEIVQDPDEAFLKSVLPDMKNMTETQKRSFKVAVLRIAGEILNQPVVMPPSISALNSVTSEATDTPSKRNESSPLSTFTTLRSLSQYEIAETSEQSTAQHYSYTFFLPQYSVISHDNDSATPNQNTQQFSNLSKDFPKY